MPMRDKNPALLARFHSGQMRKDWRDRILWLASRVQDGEVGIEAYWSISEARILYELALQWHAYNRALVEGMSSKQQQEKWSEDQRTRRKAQANEIRQAAKTLGTMGGRSGGLARAKKLTPEKRSEIAKKAAAARWGKI